MGNCSAKVLMGITISPYLFSPSKVLLAISTSPPVGLATTPIKPFPTPLKNPAAPSALAPETQDKILLILTFDYFIQTSNTGKDLTFTIKKIEE